MSKPDYPVTPAIRFLRDHGVQYTPQLYEYEEHGGTRKSAEELGVDEHCIIKTLIMESDPKHQLIVLMHGDREVSTKTLARLLGVKQITPCSEQAGMRATGYQFGGTSPFGTRQKLLVYVERTIFELPQIYINGGKRGFLVQIVPGILKELLECEEVEVGIKN
jgi:Cys-tRNA(Pro) deacylase